MTSRDRKTPNVPQIPRMGDTRNKPVRFAPRQEVTKIDTNDIGAIYDVGNPLEQAAAVKLRAQYQTKLTNLPQRNEETMQYNDLEETSRVAEDPGPIH